MSSFSQARTTSLYRLSYVRSSGFAFPEVFDRLALWRGLS